MIIIIMINIKIRSEAHNKPIYRYMCANHLLFIRNKLNNSNKHTNKHELNRYLVKNKSKDMLTNDH